ncbi:MAG TPA: PHP domain-containing protein [Phototrophicaceae bacterium]|nr:PHP domain-containing protein [Phototrophicaceae bacterium]
MSELWNVDLHSHTLWSKDCLTAFETIITVCQQRGIHRIAITDHNTADGALALQKLAPELIIPGEEIMTTQGEILVYYVQESVPARLTPEETIRRLRDQGAIISVSHPFDRLRHGAWREADLSRIVGLVDAIEVFNARCLYPEDNDRAIAFAQQHGLAGTVGSDAHTRVEYGRAVLQMPPFEGAQAFLAALREAQVKPGLSPFYVHLGSTLAKWSKKLGLRPRQWEGG